MPYFIISLTFSIILSVHESVVRIIYEQVCKMIEYVSEMMEKCIAGCRKILYTNHKSKHSV